jgi:4-hydroxy-tetrahydrodipicolinate synthase
MQAGGSGVISATANVNGAEIAKLCRDWDSPEANEKQAKINRIRAAFGRFAMIPAMKTAVAARLEDDEWLRVRAPLVALDIKQRTELLESLAAVGFEATKQAAINVD